MLIRAPYHGPELHWLCLFMCHFTCLTATNLNTELEYSRSLVQFLDHTLSSCTVRTIFDAESVEDENTFINLIIHYSTTASSEITHIQGSQTFSSETWSLKRHSFCDSHIYILRTRGQLHTAITEQFKEFSLKRENPQLIILWDTSNVAKWDWEQVFKHAQFWTSFMDYRFYIGKGFDSNSTPFGIRLICIPCSIYKLGHPEVAVLLQIQQPIFPNIHDIWKTSHKNLNLLPYTWYGNPERRKHRVELDQLVSDKLNATYGGSATLEKYSQGVITSALNLFPSYAKIFFLQPRRDRMLLVGSSFNPEPLQLTTVTRRSLMKRIGWRAFIQPLDNSAWSLLLASLLAVFIIILIASGHRFGLSISLVFFLAAALTERCWSIQRAKPPVTFVLVSWSLLCLSVTCLYGGDMVASLASANTPIYPTTAEELGSYGTRLATITLTRAYTGIFYPQINDGIDAYLKWAKTPEKGKNLEKLEANVERWKNLRHQLEKTSCQPRYIRKSVSKHEPPYSCATSPNEFRYEKPMTFIDSIAGNMVLRNLFDESPRFWVSPISNINEFMQYRPIIVSRNYFGKLVVPIVDSLWQGGLLINSLVDLRVSLKKRLGRKSAMPASRANLHSSLAQPFVPMPLELLMSTAIVFAIMIGFSAVLLAIEVMKGIGMHSINPFSTLQEILKTKMAPSRAIAACHKIFCQTKTRRTGGF